MAIIERTYEEKRSYIRMKVDTAIYFTMAGNADRYEGRCRDLSGAGMLIESGKKLQIAQRLNVSVPAQGPDFQSLNALVEVIRVRPYPDQHKFEYGLLIRKISQ